MTSRDITYRVGVRDRASGPFRRIGRSLENLKRQAAFQRLSAGLRGFGAGIGGVTRRVAGLTAALTGLSGVAGLAGAALMLKRYAESTDELAKFSRQIGFAVQSYRELQFVAERQGVSQEKLKSSMVALTKRVGELKNKTGSLYSFLKKSNPQLLKQLETTESTEKAFGLLLGALEKIEDPTERAALAAAAFSRSGVDMTRIAEAGAGGIASLRAEFRRLAGTMTKEDAANAEKYQDALTNLSKALGGAGFEAARRVLPELTPLIKDLTDVIADNREFIGEKAGQAVRAIGESLKSVDWAQMAQNLTETASALTSVGEALGGFGIAMLGLVLLRPASAGLFAFAAGIFLVGRAIHSAGDFSEFLDNLGKLSSVQWITIGAGVAWAAWNLFKLATAFRAVATAATAANAATGVGGAAAGGAGLLAGTKKFGSKVGRIARGGAIGYLVYDLADNVARDIFSEKGGWISQFQKRLRESAVANLKSNEALTKTGERFDPMKGFNVLGGAEEKLGISKISTDQAMKGLQNSLETGFQAAKSIVNAFAAYFPRALDITASPKVDTSSIDRASSSVDRLRRNLTALSQMGGVKAKAPPVKTPKGFAGGGRYRAGEPMIVGERGMELMVPDTSGFVVNNKDLLGRAIRAGAVGAGAADQALRKVLARLEIVMPNAPKGTRLTYAESEPLFGAPRLKTGRSMGGI